MTKERDVSFRHATKDDLDRLRDLRRAFTFEDHADDTPRRSDYAEAFSSVVGEGLDSRRWVVWVAEVGGDIVSHAYVGLIEKIPRPTIGFGRIGYLTNVYTVPEHRARGIGSALLDRVTSWARDEDVELLVVWPSDESVAFYERSGFRSGRDPLVWERRG